MRQGPGAEAQTRRTAGLPWPLSRPGQSADALLGKSPLYGTFAALPSRAPSLSAASGLHDVGVCLVDTVRQLVEHVLVLHAARKERLDQLTVLQTSKGPCISKRVCMQKHQQQEQALHRHIAPVKHQVRTGRRVLVRHALVVQRLGL